MAEHDVSTFVTGLGTRLATRSRHVVAFLGAGSSRACGLPDVQALQASIKDQLHGPQQVAYERLTTTRNLEQALSRIRRIGAVVEGSDSIDGLDAAAARALDERICEIIVQELTREPTRSDPILDFGSWLARSDYVRPLEVFTVNYDLLIERALEAYGSPYFDGFVGYLRGNFRADYVESGSFEGSEELPRQFVRLWKLHGSLNWAWRDQGSYSEVVRLGAAVDSGSPVAIYPSDAKYEESRRMPFVVLQDRLRHALAEPESLTLISGYAWGDDHLNELFFEASSRRARNETIVFCFADIPEVLSRRAERTPNLQVISPTEAILGGIRAPWTSGPTALSEDVWLNDQLRLGDFSYLARYLARASASESTPIALDMIRRIFDQGATNV
ncbi:SIR2 family protein [Clavibacter sp. Sh2141]|uniref:SIR2 family protein n=1 Tax=Clavibacter sp. Sh2141 TaxID=3395374 RepID=UPI0039BD3D86